MRQRKESYLADGGLAQEDKLDTAARLGWHSSRVCHNGRRRRRRQVEEREGVSLCPEKTECPRLRNGETGGLSAGCLNGVKRVSFFIFYFFIFY